MLIMLNKLNKRLTSMLNMLKISKPPRIFVLASLLKSNKSCIMKTNLTLLAATAAALLCLLPADLRAQQVDTNPVELPSTSVWQQMKYNNVAGASLYTGTLRLSIPLFSYHDADFDIPLSLDYATNGFRPNVMTGLVGHEWSLGLGGAITRTIRGLPDEKRTASFFGFQEMHHNYPSITGPHLINGYNADFDDLSIQATAPRIYYAPSGFGNDGPFVDMEPDIFQFNFLGHSGKFLLGYAGAIHVFDTDTRNEAYRIEVPTVDLDEIVIVAGDGTRYTFGTGLAREYAGDVTTAWKLARIDTPSGRSVIFSYTRSPRGTYGNFTYTAFNSYAPDTHCYSFFGGYYDNWQNWYEVNLSYKPTAATLNSVMTVSAPDAVTFDNGAAIDFFYANPAELETGDGISSLLNLPKLDSVVVRAPGGTAVRTCSLSYAYPTAPASNKICFLSAVEVSGEGTWSFDYNYGSNTVFPKHGTFKIDHWGFFNNSSATPATFYTHTTQGDYLEETIGTTLRNPNASAAMLGVMTAVHYPTGGRTTFEYEGQDYSHYEGNTGYPNFEPNMCANPGFVAQSTGGVRIKAIQDYDSASASTPVYYRTYSYLDADGHSSGVRGPLPRYGLNYIKTRNNGDHIDVYLGSYNNLLPADGTHIEYSRVTENLPQGKNVYTFITRLDCPDGKEVQEYSNIYNLTFQTMILPSVTGDTAIDAIFALMSPSTSMQASRGKMLSATAVDEQGVGKQFKTITYEPYFEAYRNLDIFWNYQSMYLGATRVPTVIGNIHPLSTTTVTDGVSDTETLVYDGFHNIRSRTRGGLTSKFLYFHSIDNLSDFSDFKEYSWWYSFIDSGVYNRMKALNLVDYPLQTEVFDEDGVLHIRRYIYDFRTAYDLSAVYLKSVEERDGWLSSGSWRTIVSYDARDVRGRILQQSDADGIPTTYVWGYNGLYPVAEIVGATLTQVKAVSGLSGIETAPLSGALTAAQVTALRNISGAEVTTWEYAPLVGLTKETTPDGRSTSYTYNASGKLHQVLDDLGHKTAAYLYSPDNKQQ